MAMYIIVAFFELCEIIVMRGKVSDASVVSQRTSCANHDPDDEYYTKVLWTFVLSITNMDMSNVISKILQNSCIIFEIPSL